MTTTDTEAMSALHKLLDERLRFQGWLATLESRRSATPPHVYERVQKDYAARLERVMQSLAERAGQLSGTIESMVSELAGLRQHEAERTDERHESELRAAVGEFTAEDWDRLRAEADSELEKIAAQRHALESELEELQRIIALTGSISAAPDYIADDAASAGPSEFSAHSEFAEPAGFSAPAEPAEPATAAGIHVAEARSVTGSDETPPSIEQFVADWHPPRVSPDSSSEERGEASGKAPLGSHGASDAASHAASHAASDLGDLVIPGASVGANPVGAAGADYGMANGVVGAAGGLEPTRVPAAVGDSRRDADKTLKCPECGTMNYATEWYCERCGGELSTF